MDHQDMRTLKILEEIDKEEVPSQRHLARELNISLGLVNSFIKRLAHKGYFKITNIPANRVRYILTPTGAAEKARLTYEYIQYSYQFYKGARHKSQRTFTRLGAQQVRRIVFLGVGDLAEIAYVSLQETPIQLIAVVDDQKKGEKFLGYSVKEVKELHALVFDKILLTAIDSRDSYLQKLLAADIPPEMVEKIG
ncbi:MAG: hypothetical protein A2521_03575 [Deltaproteobacteria bacterium RIFOXYD12_FULL_57_12]|nr:MAG: hypothetical protein A2521_03575 [Deltaproteobacteria bacterium RIFOXYD12_FULL_57_12]